MKSLIVENRKLHQRVQKLLLENQSLRKQCSENCHEDLIESLRVKYSIPTWLLSKTSYEILANKDFEGVEKYMKALSLDSRFGYAFLLDQEGIIRWQGQGFATAETLKELFETAEHLAHSSP